MKNSRSRKDGTLRLTSKERQRLAQIIRGDEASGRIRARAQILQLSDLGWDRQSISEASGASISTVGRVRRQYFSEGLSAALTEKPRPGADRRLDEKQIQRVIAVVCSAPPEGFTRWSVRLLTEEVQHRGIVDDVSRETIRIVLRDHDLKPWREKNVVCSTA